MEVAAKSFVYSSNNNMCPLGKTGLFWEEERRACMIILPYVLHEGRKSVRLVHAQTTTNFSLCVFHQAVACTFSSLCVLVYIRIDLLLPPMSSTCRL